MKKLLTFLMAIALVLVPVRALADDEDVTIGYEIVSEVDEDYFDEDEDEFYDDYEDDYEDYEDYEDEYYDDEDYDYDISTFDEQMDLENVPTTDGEAENTVTLSVCNVVLLATIPFIAGLLVGAGVMLLSYKAAKKEDEKKKENKKNDK